MLSEDSIYHTKQVCTCVLEVGNKIVYFSQIM